MEIKFAYAYRRLTDGIKSSKNQVEHTHLQKVKEIS